jgi:hypothetical protein
MDMFNLNAGTIDLEKVDALLPEGGKMCASVMKALEVGLQRGGGGDALSLAASVPPGAFTTVFRMQLQMLVDVFHESANVEYLNLATPADEREALELVRVVIPGHATKSTAVVSSLWSRLNKGWFNKNEGGAQLVAYTYDGTKLEMFNKQLLQDALFSAGALVVAFAITWVHTGSFFITAMAFFTIITSLGVSYFAYFNIFSMPFFPFLNLVVIFLLIGIGCDDIFVYMDTWKHSFCHLPDMEGEGEDSTPLEVRVQWTLDRAGGAMFVTSATTAAAFFANAISPITSIRCFGIFAGYVEGGGGVRVRVCGGMGGVGWGGVAYDNAVNTAQY